MAVREVSWYENPENLLEFTEYLIDIEGFTAKEIWAVFEKPWKWDNEYEEFQKLPKIL